MKSPIKISVTIPTYKRKFLKECIDSILSQTFDNFELIIVNDASPENIEEVIDKYDDNRIKYYVNKHNCGAENVVDNWNKCLEYATGDYVLCMGDDDKLTPNCLELYCNRILEKPNVAVFHIQTLLINEKSEIIGAQTSRPDWESVYSAIYNKFNGRLQFIGDWLFKTESLRNYGGFIKLPYAWFSDDITPLIVGEKTGIENINEFGFLYRSNSLTISSNSNNSFGKIQSCNKAFEWYRNFLADSISNSHDEIFRMLSLEMLPIIKRQKIEEIISEDMKKERHLKLLLWLLNSRKMQISLSIISRGYLKSYR